MAPYIIFFAHFLSDLCGKPRISYVIVKQRGEQKRHWPVQYAYLLRVFKSLRFKQITASMGMRTVAERAYSGVGN